MNSNMLGQTTWIQTLLATLLSAGETLARLLGHAGYTNMYTETVESIGRNFTES